MKPISKIMLSLLLLSFASSGAMAVDHPVPKRDLPPAPTNPTGLSEISTINETTKPVELIGPEGAIDKAINTPIKNKPIDNEINAVDPQPQIADTKVERREKTGYRVKKYSAAPKKQKKKKHIRTSSEYKKTLNKNN